MILYKAFISCALVPLLLISCSGADYVLQGQETGKYLWYNKGSGKNSTCCYCPEEAMLNEKTIQELQIDPEHGCDGEVEEYKTGNKTIFKYPFCICEERLGLKPEFIGCELPNSTEVIWDCNNNFIFPNVTVYTVCEPTRCQDQGKVLTGSLGPVYRCNEARQWEQDPYSVYCKYKSEDNWSTIIIITAACGVPLLIFSIIIVIFLTCLKKNCSTLCKRGSYSFNMLRKNKKKSSNSSGSDSQTGSTSLTGYSSVESIGQPSEESIELKVDQKINVHAADQEHLNSVLVNECVQKGPESIVNNDSDEREDKIQEIPDEEMPLLDGNEIVRVKNASKEMEHNGKPYYSVIKGKPVVIVTSQVQNDSDFTINRPYDRHELNHFIIDCVDKKHDGKYNWTVKNKNGNYTEGTFYLSVEEGRQTPPGGSIVNDDDFSFNQNNLETMSMQSSVSEQPSVDVKAQALSFRRTEDISNFSANNSGHTELHSNNSQKSVSEQPSVDVKAQALSFRRTEDISNFSANNSGHTELHSNNSQKSENVAYDTCCLSVYQWEEDPYSLEHLNNICQMLDPMKNELSCWKGFCKFYRDHLKMEIFTIESIEYHTKGNPENGHMKYVLENHLLAHDFKIGHIVYYFSLQSSYRSDVLSEIKKFHNNCPFCDKFIYSM